MKVDLKTFIFLVFVGLNSFAQTPDRRGFIGINVGPTFYIGDLSYTNSENTKAQFAKNGYCNNIANFGYIFSKHFGICASAFYGETYVDNTSTEDWWVMMGLSVGPMLSFPIRNKLYFDQKIRIGYLGTINYINETANSNDFGKGFVVDYRTSIRYNIFKRFCIMLEAGYSYTNQIFPDSRKVAIQQISTNIGVAYRLR